jgi:hypothetical protein
MKRNQATAKPYQSSSNTRKDADANPHQGQRPYHNREDHYSQGGPPPYANPSRRGQDYEGYSRPLPSASNHHQGPQPGGRYQDQGRWDTHEPEVDVRRPPGNMYRGQAPRGGSRGGSRGDRGGSRDGRGGGRGRGGKRGEQGYSDHEERSGDEDIEQHNYNAMQRQRGGRQADFADFFESRVEPSRSRSRSASLPHARQQDTSGQDGGHGQAWDGERAELNGGGQKMEEKRGLDRDGEKREEESEDSEDGSRSLSKMLEESILDQQKILEKNAEMLSIPKKPKKGKKKQQDDGTRSGNLGDLMKKQREFDDKFDIDTRTRITGTIVKDHQRENKPNFRRDEEGNFREPGRQTGRRLKINKPKFVGLTGKFEYRSLIQAGRHMFTKTDVFNDTNGDISKLQINDEGLKEAAGFGKLDDSVAQVLMDQMMMNFSLAIMYSGHYSKFAQSKIP